MAFQMKEIRMSWFDKKSRDWVTLVITKLHKRGSIIFKLPYPIALPEGSIIKVEELKTR